MKVNVYQTIEVSDEQRVQLADVLDGKTSKRQATRDEIKEYAWSHGASWSDDLVESWNAVFGDPDSDSDEPDLDDLL